MLTRIVSRISHAVTPLRLAVVLGVAVIATSTWNAGELSVSKVALAIAAIVVIVYWLTRPSEWQLRHLMADDDIMVVPLRTSLLPWRSVGEQYGDPSGSETAVELEMDRSVLVLGETGSGKTKAIEVLAHQMRADPDEPLVAFDYKQDYQTFFSDVLRVSSKGSDVVWNVFKEIEEEDDCTEISRAVFSTAENNYFSNTAAQVFEGVLILLHRWGQQDDYQPSNEDLLKYVEGADVESVRQDFEEEELSAAKHMSEDAEASQNILSNLEMQVQEVFSGDFARDGDFSVREYMQDPQGRKLILDFPVDRSESVKPIFRLLIDWSIRYGMLDDRGSYYILDEFAGLPKLGMLERLVNAGRAYNCYCVLGVQSISQVNDTYGREKAKSLLSGMAQEVHLRVGEDSVRYWRERLGKDQIERGNGDYVRVQEEHAISPREIQNLQPGQGVIHTTTGWQRGRLFMLEEVIDDLLPQGTFRHQVEQAATAARSALPAGRGDEQRIETDDPQPLPDD